MSTPTIRAALERLVELDDKSAMRLDSFLALWTDAIAAAARAALLQQLSAPAPVAVPVAADVQYEFSVLDGDDCEQAGGSAPTLDDAIREGQHYLSQYNRAWDPHRLELRSVQVIPLPQSSS
jgi:hypothetical protein